MSLKTVGEVCLKLRKLTLSGFCRVTDEGFTAFAVSQRKNAGLREIYLLCRDLEISVKGLSLVWLLPLSIKTLQCDAVNFLPKISDDFDFEIDDEIDDALLECENGPCQLTDLIISWCFPGRNIEKILDRSEMLFPSLRNMHWKSPPQALLKSGPMWKTVKSVYYLDEGDAIDSKAFTLFFPNLISLRLEAVSLINPQEGSFSNLVHFSHGPDAPSGQSLSFDDFSSIMAQAKNIRLVAVTVLPQVRAQYTDGAMCGLFRKWKHLSNLEELSLEVDGEDATFPLTEAAVSCILQTCGEIKLLGPLRSWNVDPDLVRQRYGEKWDVFEDRPDNFQAVGKIGHWHKPYWYKT